MNLLTNFKKTILPPLIIVVLGCFGLLLQAQARDIGCFPNFTTAIGCGAVDSLDTGAGNTGLGWFALNLDSTGNFNTAVGAGALDLNNADNNTATGAAALLLNTTGTDNTANGVDALVFNNTGGGNTGTGAFTLFSNTEGNFNTANGEFTLYFNTIGEGNTAIGDSALHENTEGNDNTAVGISALLNNTTGSDNTAIGSNAGGSVLTAGNVTCIGSNVAGADVSNTTWIGNVYAVATQSGTTAPVIVSDTGQLGTVVSSERFKKDVASMDKASETVLSLRPVTFHYKTDTKDTQQFGLIAEEVAKLNPALVLSDKEGKPYTVRYDAVNAMLLNEFLKEHRVVQKQQKEIDNLKAELQEQKALIQKVSARLELGKSAPQTVLNNQ